MVAEGCGSVSEPLSVRQYEWLVEELLFSLFSRRRVLWGIGKGGGKGFKASASTLI
jgi:hypothetical protein